MNADVIPGANIGSTRLVSIDAFRGWVMLLLLASLLGFCEVSERLPENPTWRWLCYQWSHVEWRGMTLHDIIQPSFSFLVGTSLAFSVVSRRRRGQNDRNLIIHAAWRSLVLVLLGVFLRSIGRGEISWTFEDTLSQIGLGYLPLVMIAIAPPVATWISIAVILIGYWLAFVLHPLPPSDFDFSVVGVDSTWPFLQDGFAAHWNKNSNLAWRFDTWFLNLFPRSKPFAYNSGGYSTLSFIPTLATMLLGLVAGWWLNERENAKLTLKRFATAAVICFCVGHLLDLFGICPNVKRIWTPSWVLVSGGWCFFILGILHVICDLRGFRAWCYPLVVIGSNSIVAYLMEWFMAGSVENTFTQVFGPGWAESIVGEIYHPLLVGGVTMVISWGILFWMHRHKIYVKL